MNRISALIKKEFIHFYRDPISVSLIIYHFTLCVFLCGYCWVTDAKQLNTIVYDMNRSSVSRDLIDRFMSTEYFNLYSYAVSMKEVEDAIDQASVRIALIIPADFTRNLNDEKPAKIQMICDGTDGNLAGQALGFSEKIVASFNGDIVIDKLQKKGIAVSQLPGVDNISRILYNQEMEGVYYVVIYHIVVAGLIGGLLLSSTALVREKERGTIDQLMVTPTRSWELLLAKTITPILISLLATVFSFLVIFHFDVPCRGNPAEFFLFMAFFLIGITGIGICIGVFCSNMLQAILLSFAVWFGGIFTAGIVTPIDNYVPVLKSIAQVIPTYHFNIASSGIFQKGIGISVLWPEALKLLLTGAGLLVIGCIMAYREFRQ